MDIQDVRWHLIKVGLSIDCLFSSQFYNTYEYKYIDLSVKIFEEIPETLFLGRGKEGVLRLIKDAQGWESDQNLMAVDRRSSNFQLFCGHHKWMTPLFIFHTLLAFPKKGFVCTVAFLNQI